MQSREFIEIKISEGLSKPEIRSQYEAFLDQLEEISLVDSQE